ETGPSVGSTISAVAYEKLLKMTSEASSNVARSSAGAFALPAGKVASAASTDPASGAIVSALSARKRHGNCAHATSGNFSQINADCGSIINTSRSVAACKNTSVGRQHA